MLFSGSAFSALPSFSSYIPLSLPDHHLYLLLPSIFSLFLLQIFHHCHSQSSTPRNVTKSPQTMGREWYWGGGGGGGTNKSSKRKSTSKKPDAAGGMAAATAAASAPAGCMCAVFQLFDFHQLPFSTPLNHRPSFHIPHHPPSVPKGSEAPRNSLELLEEMEDRASSLPLAVKAAHPQNLNIPMGIQIKTARGRTRPGSAGQSDSETVPSSPATKTPTLVARLMGLDLLPENQNYSPRSSASSSTTPYKLSHHLTSRTPKQHHRRSCDDSGAGRSLPETPRISSARRSDVDHYHHRLSLQLNNKENTNTSEELVISRIKALKLNGRDLKPEEECRSPRQYARQIVKQVKESVSRRVGLLDITNNQSKNRDPPLPEKQSRRSSGGGGGGGGGSRRRDNDLVKSKKASKLLTRLAEEEEEEDLFVNLVPLKKDRKVLDELSQSRKQSILSAPISSRPLPNNEEKSAVKLMVVSPPIATTTGKKEGGGKRGLPPQTSDIIRNKQEEPFVRPSAGNRGGGGNIPDKRCRKTPLSSNLLQGISVPSIILPVKKDPAPPATKILSPQKQADSKRSTSSSQLPSSPSHTASYRLTSHHQQEATRPLPSEETGHQKQAAAVSIAGDGSAAAAEYEYITRILKRTGIDKNTPISFTKWFSPAHPLDPTIFYHLEHITTATTTPPPSSGHVIPPSDRKLLFHLTDEILSGILKPYINVKPWTTTNRKPRPPPPAARGSDLINDLCRRIRSFPNADCKVLEDIDALIDKDLPERWMETAAEEEGERIVTDVEKEILESLIQETAGEVLVSLGAKRRRAVSRGHVLGREFDHVRRR
ncbi:hypothetical protein LINGRAHAP2_LOCUS22098 [Linum grandiflorum]